MILPNNPRIDTEEVDARVASVSAGRRRARMAAAQSDAASRDGGLGSVAGDVAEPAHAQAPAGALGNGAALREGDAGAQGATRQAGGWRARLGAVPLVGALATLLADLVRLPRFRRDVVEVNEILRTELRRLGDAQEQLRGVLAEMADGKVQRIERLETRLGLIETRIATQNRALRRLERALEASGRLAGAPAATPAGTSATAKSAAPETAAGAPLPAGALGGFYAEFEARFRGARESIKARQRPYLVQVRNATAGRPQARCVDIGCGRGEWLELLTEQGLAPVGLDLDPGMVMEARQAGLDARVADGILWLEQQCEDSVDVVTAFQVIEHLSFEHLLRLLDAALRALAPGGVAIFETPNPENLLVATNSFHLDPTHRRPIPPPLAEFLAQQRGFARVELLRLNALPAEMRVAGEGELTSRVNQLLYGAQDYALIAWKRGADPVN